MTPPTDEARASAHEQSCGCYCHPPRESSEDDPGTDEARAPEQTVEPRDERYLRLNDVMEAIDSITWAGEDHNGAVAFRAAVRQKVAELDWLLEPDEAAAVAAPPLDREHVAETLHMMAEHPLGGACSRCRVDAQVFVAEYDRRMSIKAGYVALSQPSPDEPPR